jgi:hypothetical protein
MVIRIHTFVDVRAVSFPVDLSSLLLITLSRLSVLGSLLCCFGAANNTSMGLGSSGLGSRSVASSGSRL